MCVCVCVFGVYITVVHTRTYIYRVSSCQEERFHGTTEMLQMPRKPGHYAGHLTLSPGDPIPGSLCCVSAPAIAHARERAHDDRPARRQATGSLTWDEGRGQAACCSLTGDR